MRAATLLAVCALAGLLVLTAPAAALSGGLGVPDLADPVQDQLLPEAPLPELPLPEVPLPEVPLPEAPGAVPELLDEVTEPVGGITGDALDVVPGNPPPAGQAPSDDARVPAADAPPVLAPDAGRGGHPDPVPAPAAAQTTPVVLPSGEAALVAGTAYVPALLLVVLLGLLAFPVAGLPSPMAAARMDDDLRAFE